MRDTAEQMPHADVPRERHRGLDIRRFWGEPDAVAACVRPSGGPWHHEFVNMVTPDDSGTAASLAPARRSWRRRAWPSPAR